MRDKVTKIKKYLRNLMNQLTLDCASGRTMLVLFSLQQTNGYYATYHLLPKNSDFASAASMESPRSNHAGRWVAYSMKDNMTEFNEWVIPHPRSRRRTAREVAAYVKALLKEGKPAVMIGLVYSQPREGQCAVYCTTTEIQFVEQKQASKLALRWKPVPVE